MALTIYWSKKADKKFDEIIGFLEEEWGESVSRAFVKKVYEFLDILAEFPEIGSLQHEERNIRGFVVVKQLTIFYKITGEKIIILNFFDNRQNPKHRKY
jgi:plasmid stabilization system protein ParE